MLGLLVMLGLLAVEVVALTVWVDGASLEGRAGVVGWIGLRGSWILRAAIAFAVSFIAFAGLEGKFGAWREALAGARRVNWWAAALHVVLAAGFAQLTATLYGDAGQSSVGLALGWFATGIAMVLALALAAAPARIWRGVAVEAGPIWLYAGAVAAATWAVTSASRSLWQSTAKVTFRMVAFLVAPLYPTLIVQPERLRLRAPNFGVIIDQACSGLEGAGLMLVFLMVWLYVSRRDFRFPRALLLVPAGVGVLYLLNAVRIAALLVIGNAGAPGIATGGFHSQAGWIAFNGVALGMTLVVPRLGWFHTRPREAGHVGWLEENATAVYLLPFLAIIAAGMVARAASANFEWLYLLRPAAAAGVLWMFRGHLATLNWRAGWLGVAAGGAVFVMWIGLDQLAGTPPAAMPAALATAGGGLRWTWITIRALAAVVTVPIAEELAFRGFLMRRLDSPDFEAVAWQRASVAGVLVSSLIFGLLHGERWIAGVFAGLVYAVVARRSGKISESVVAHAVTNGLLAAWVLIFHAWQYW